MPQNGASNLDLLSIPYVTRQKKMHTLPSVTIASSRAIKQLTARGTKNVATAAQKATKMMNVKAQIGCSS